MNQYQIQVECDSGGVQDYTLVCDREPYRITPLVRYGFEYLVACALLTFSGDPSNFQKAMVGQEKDKWISVMVEDMKPLKKNETCDLVQLPHGKRAIGCKCMYKKNSELTKKEGEKFKVT